MSGMNELARRMLVWSRKWAGPVSQGLVTKRGICLYCGAALPEGKGGYVQCNKCGRVQKRQ